MDKKYLKTILSLCDYCKECIDSCTMSIIDPSNIHSPLTKIKLADLIYRNGEIPSEFIEDLAYCTTCGICNEHCAPHIDVLKLIQDLRSWAQSNNKIKEPKWDKFVNNMQEHGNPYGKSFEEKLIFLKQYNKEINQPDFHFYLGCTLTLKNTKESENILKILSNLDLNFNIIDDPICCGGVLKRIGKIQEFEKNQNLWKNYIRKNNIKEITTICPGCYSTIKDFINDLEMDVKVSHLLEKVIPQLPKLNQDTNNVELHISCHLHNHNPEIYNQLTTKLPFLSLPEKRMCCGAGGGFIGVRPENAKRIGENVLQDKTEKKIDSIITECPFCYNNLSKCNNDIKVIYFFDYLLNLI